VTRQRVGAVVLGALGIIAPLDPIALGGAVLKD